ncbi:hypothetical protein ACFX15_035113 [Malus domestica]
MVAFYSCACAFIQTQVDQITQQLKSGMLEDENDEDLLSAPQDPHHKSSKHQIDTKDIDGWNLKSGKPLVRY